MPDHSGPDQPIIQFAETDQPNGEASTPYCVEPTLMPAQLNEQDWLGLDALG